jgi:uncharacterized membrane protein YbaN (DUF454 family)
MTARFAQEPQGARDRAESALQGIAAGDAEALKMLDKPLAGATGSTPILGHVRTELRLRAHKAHNVVLPDVAFLETAEQGTVMGVVESVNSDAFGPMVCSSRWIRSLWFVLGWLAVAVGGIGVIVPGLPTTGFMIIAASCFAKSSPRFERWVLSLPRIGPAVGDFRAGRGMPKRAKIAAIAMMATAVTVSTFVVLDNSMARAVVAAAGAIGAWYVIRRVPTAAAARPN